MTDRKDPKEPTVMQEFDSLSQVKAGYTQERDLANRVLGRQQMALNFSKLATVAGLLELQKVKKDKLFKHITNPRTGDTVPTWEEYCSLLGESRRTIDERLQNLEVFGEEAIESMNTLGLGVRQLRQLRKLPEDEIKQAQQLVKEKDNESLLELIETQAIKHKEEKQAIQAALDDTAKEYQGLEKVYGDAEKRHTRTSIELEKLKKKHVDMKPTELANQFTSELESASAELGRAVVVVQKIVSDMANEVALARVHQDVMGVAFGVTQRYKERLVDIQTMFGLHAVEDTDDMDESGMPVWMKGLDGVKDEANN